MFSIKSHHECGAAMAIPEFSFSLRNGAAVIVGKYDYRFFAASLNTRSQEQ
jgi:hypothetical protein